MSINSRDIRRARPVHPAPPAAEVALPTVAVADAAGRFAPRPAPRERDDDVSDDNGQQTPATLPPIEIGFVSRDTGLLDFLRTVFELEPQPTLDLPFGSLHRLSGYGTVFKVLVPQEAPQEQKRRGSFFGVDGVRFLTVRVPDVDAVAERVVACNGRIVQGPFEPVPGVRIVLFEDPDGTTFEASQRLT